MRLPELLDTLVLRHRELAREAERLVAELGRTEAPPHVCAVLDAYVDATRFHVQREERFVFPSVLALARGEDDGVAGLEDALRVLALEHQELHALGERLRAFAPDLGEVAPLLVAFLDGCERHHEVEDAHVFPVVQDLLRTPAPSPSR